MGCRRYFDGKVASKQTNKQTDSIQMSETLLLFEIQALFENMFTT